jgi:hypothetical protein
MCGWSRAVTVTHMPLVPAAFGGLIWGGRGIGVDTQGLVLPKQNSYHLSHGAITF